MKDVSTPLAFTAIVVLLIGWLDFTLGSFWTMFSYIGAILLFFIWSFVYIMERKQILSRKQR